MAADIFSRVFIQFQGQGLLPEGAVTNEDVHAALQKKEADAVKAALAGVEGITPDEISLFMDWVSASWSQQTVYAVRLLSSDTKAGRVSGDALIALLPKGTHIGETKDGKAVDSTLFLFNRVNPELSHQGMLFTYVNLGFVEAILTNLKSDPKFQSNFAASKNRAEEYLNLVAALLPRSAEQAAKMSGQEIDIVWEALARVDAERPSNPIIRTKLNHVDKTAAAFLNQLGLHRMPQMALAERDGRQQVAGFDAGNGADWSAEIKGLLDPDKEGNDPLDVKIAQQIFGAIKEQYNSYFRQYYGMSFEQLLEMDGDAYWYEVNGVGRSCPAIACYQLLKKRIEEAWGFHFHKFISNSGQSQGESMANLKSSGWGRDRSVVVPTLNHVFGYHGEPATRNFVKWMLGEARAFEKTGPNIAGANYTLAVSGIPHDEDGFETPLGKLLVLVNAQCGNGEHVTYSNVNTPGPDYFIMLAGTPHALRLTDLLIKGLQRQWELSQYPADVRGPIGNILAAAQKIWAAGIPDKKRVGDPQGMREFTSVSFPAHDPIALQVPYEEFRVEVDANGGSTMFEPETAMVSPFTGRDIRDDFATATGTTYANLLGADQFLHPVWVARIAHTAAELGATVEIDFGPGTHLGRSFLRRAEPGVPIITASSKEGRELLHTTDPLRMAELLDQASGGFDDVFLPGGGTIGFGRDGALEVKTPQASASKATGLAAIPGIQVDRIESESPKQETQIITVHQWATFDDAQVEAFREAFFAIDRGGINELLKTEKMIKPDGSEVVNPFHALIRPRPGWTFETITTSAGVKQFNITEDGALSVEIVPTGKSFLVKTHFSKTDPNVVLARKFGLEGGKIVETTKNLAALTRKAYRPLWSSDRIANLAKMLALKPVDDVLSKFKLAYSVTVTPESIMEHASSLGSTNPKHRDPNVKGGIEGAPSFMKDRIMGDSLAAMLAEFLDLNPLGIRNIGGTGMQTGAVKPGKYDVEVQIRQVTDINEGALSGRRVVVYIEVKQGQDIVGQELFDIVDITKPVNFPAGAALDVFKPREDLPANFDHLQHRIVYEMSQRRLVATGQVEFPENAAEMFVDDKNPIHVFDAASILSGDLDAKILQGEVTFNRILDPILKNKWVTWDAPSHYVGFANRQFSGTVVPGETLNYTVMRTKNAEGLHEYEVEVTNQEGDPVLRFTLYAYQPKTMYMWTGQGALEAGGGVNMHEEVVADPARKAVFDFLQAKLHAEGYDIDMAKALREATSDTAKAQPAQAGYMVPFWEEARGLGIVSREAIHSGLSLGLWFAMYGAGYMDGETLVKGLGLRGREMQALVDETMGMGVIKPYNGNEEQLKVLCQQVSREGEGVVELSNYNTDRQMVVGGHKTAIARLGQKIAELKLGVLSPYDEVSTPFHTSLLAGATRNMQAAFDGHNPFASPVRDPARVLVDTTVEFIDPSDPATIARVFAEQISRQTRFAQVVRTGYEAEGVRVFVEVGPRETLTKHAFSMGKNSMGLDPKEDMRILFMNRQMHPEHWDVITGDFDVASGGVEEAQPATQPDATVSTPATSGGQTQTSAPAQAVPDMAAMMATMAAAPAGAVSSAAPVSAEELRADQVEIANSIISRSVDAGNVANSGSENLYQLIKKKANTIDVATDADFQALVGTVAEEYKKKGPGAVDVLEQQVTYMKGVLGLGGSLPKSPLWGNATEAELLELVKQVWVANQKAGGFEGSLVMENFAPDADLSHKGAKPIGINSKKIPGAVRMITGSFGVWITDDEAKNEIRTLGDLLKILQKRLSGADPKVIPNKPSEVRHLAMIHMLAQEKALGALKAQQSSTPAQPAMGMPMMMAMASAQGAGAQASFTPVSATELRADQVEIANSIISRSVDAGNVANSGSENLYQLIKKKANTIDVATDADFQALVGTVAEEYKKKGPGAVDVLEQQVTYMKGVLGLGGSLPKSPLWGNATEAELLELVKQVWVANQKAGGFEGSLVMENFAPDADLSHKGAKPIGINSKKIPGAVRMITGSFGVWITDDEAKNEIRTLGDLLKILQKRLSGADPKVIPNKPSEVRHLAMIHMLAQEKALEALKAQRSSASAAPALGMPMPMMMGGGASQAQIDAAKEELRADFARMLQKGAREHITAYARAMGLPVTEDGLQQIAVTPSGDVVPVADIAMAQLQARLERVEAAFSVEAVDAVANTNFRTDWIYTVGDPANLGSLANLVRFIRDVRNDRLPKDAYDRGTIVNGLANQLTEKGLKHLKWARESFTAPAQLALIDQLMARTEQSLKLGPQFDGVIRLHGAVHKPVYGQQATTLEDRGLGSFQLIERYRQAGLPESTLRDLTYLLEHGRDLRGLDVVVTGGGTIGEPDIADLLRLGARVIVLDYKRRSANEGPNAYRSDRYRDLLNENGIRGIENQLVVVPGYSLPDYDAMEVLNNYLAERGYRPRLFLHTGAVHDYDVIINRGRPHHMAQVHGFFPRDFETWWANWNVENEDKLREEFLAREKGNIIAVELTDIPEEYREKYKKHEGKVQVLVFEDASGAEIYLPLDEAFHHFMVSNRYPTPNEFNQLKGSKNYDLKAIARTGATSKRVFNDGIRYRNGDPALIEDQHRTGGTYPATPISPSSKSLAEMRLMEAQSLVQDGFERGAGQIGADFYGFQGNEMAGISIATATRKLAEGPLSHRQFKRISAAEVLPEHNVVAHHADGTVTVRQLPKLAEESDSTAGFTALENRLAELGQTMGDFSDRVSLEEDAEHQRRRPLVVKQKTDAVHMPLDGSLNDLNQVFRQVVIRDGRTEGDFAPSETDIIPTDDTMVTLSVGAVHAGGYGPVALIQYWAWLTNAEFPEELQWLTKPDLFGIARMMGELGIDVAKLRTMSLEEIEKYFIENDLFEKLGSQRLEDAQNFTFNVWLESETDQIYRVKNAQMAEYFINRGFEVSRDRESGQLFVKVPKGAKVPVPAQMTLATDRVFNLPGGAENVNYAEFGIGSREEDQRTGAYAQHIGKMSTGQAYMRAGVTPALLNAEVGRQNRPTIKTLALADSLPMEASILDERNGETQSGDNAAAFLGDGWAGQDASEQADTTASVFSLPQACSSGAAAKIVAGIMNDAAHYAVMMGRTPEGNENKVYEVGASDNAARAFMIGAFIAARALHTYEAAEKTDRPAGRWSQANNVDAAGFVPGVGAAVEMQRPVRYAKGQNYMSATIGYADATDGRDEGPREAYGIGLVLSLFRAWAQARTQIPGKTDREKLANVQVSFEGHETSTPLGDPFENRVKLLLTKYAGVAQIKALYTPGHRWFLGVKNFEELLDPSHPIYVNKMMPESGDYLIALDQFLEARLPAEVRAVIGMAEGQVATDEASKVVFGHTLGAHSALDSAKRQAAFSKRVILGNSSLDQPREELASQPNLVQTNLSFSLDEAGFLKPLLKIGLAAGFSHKNTAIIEVEVKRAFDTVEEAVADTASRARQWALERTQLRAEADGLRKMVGTVDLELTPVETYKDLHLLYTRSQAIARLLIAEGRKDLNFNRIEQWARILPADPDIVLKDEERAFQAAFKRIEDIAQKYETNYADKLARQRVLAGQQERAEQPYLIIGGSDGMGMRTLISKILAGEVKHAVVVHFDRPHINNEPYMNAQAIKAWAWSKGVHLEVVNQSGVIFESSSFRFEGKNFPDLDSIDFTGLKYKPFHEDILRAIQKVGEMAGSQDWNLDNFIAFGAPERTPGAGKLPVESIDPQHRLYFATTEDTESWEESIDRTIGAMGFNHWAIMTHAYALGLIGAKSVVRQADWKNGADERNEALQGVYYGIDADGNMVASLGIAKAIAKKGIEWIRNTLASKAFIEGDDKARINIVYERFGFRAAQSARKLVYTKEYRTADAQGKLELLQNELKKFVGNQMVVAYPFFFSAASRQIPGAWLWGLQQKRVLDESGHFMDMENLAISGNVGVLEAFEGLKVGDMAKMMIEVDQYEYDAIPEVARRAKEIGLKEAMKKWMREHPEQVIWEDGVAYIPPSASKELIKDLVPQNSEEIVGRYLPDEVRRAREMTKGASPLHGGMPSVNSRFGEVVSKFEPISLQDGSASLDYQLPANHTGYPGILHGGMIASTFDAVAQAVIAGGDFKGDAGKLVSQVEFVANAKAGLDARLDIKVGENGTLEIKLVDPQLADEKAVLAKAIYQPVTTSAKEGQLGFTTPDGQSASFAKRAALRPGQLYADIEFTCIDHCVAAGWGHDTGLQFKYGWHDSNRAIWGVFDPIEGVDWHQQITPAVDDAAFWAGLKAVGMGGFTTDIKHYPLRQPKAGERVFLVSQSPKDIQGQQTADITVQLMNAQGDVLDVYVVTYFVQEEASIDLMIRALDSLAAHQDDPRAQATYKFYADALGKNFKRVEILTHLKRGKMTEAPKPTDPSSGGGGKGGGGRALTVEHRDRREAWFPDADLLPPLVVGNDGRLTRNVEGGEGAAGTGDAKASAILTVAGRQPTVGAHGVGSNIVDIDHTGGVIAGGMTYVTDGGAVRVVHEEPLIADPVVVSSPVLRLVKDGDADDVVGANPSVRPEDSLQAANSDVEVADDASSLTSDAPFTIGTGQGIGMGHAIVGGTPLARSAAARLFVVR